MEWWKTAQSDCLWKEAGIMEFLKKRTSITIPLIVLNALFAMQGIDSFLQKLNSLPTQQERDSYVIQVKNDVLNKLEIEDQPVLESPFIPSEAEIEPEIEPEVQKETIQNGPSDDTNLPRGIRNNNPGNIDFNTNVNWQGMAEARPHDGRFIRFESPEYGIRAMARVLRTYQRKHNLNTLSSIINRWAPPSENNTRAYIQSISRETGFAPDQLLNLEDNNQLADLMNAMIRHENGQNPYTDQQILTGIGLE